MAKTGLNKLEVAMHVLNLATRDLSDLVGFMTDSIVTAESSCVQINSISNQFVADALFSLSGIRVSSSNLSYYKNCPMSFDLTRSVAERLGVPVLDWVKCEVILQEGKLKVMPLANGPVRAMQNFLSIPHSPQIKVEHYYRIWAENGNNVGHKRNWIKPALVDWLQKHNIVPAIPLSHHRPTELKAVYAHLLNLCDKNFGDCQTLVNKQNWVDEGLLKFCNDSIKLTHPNPKKWLAGYRNLPEIKYVDSVDAQDRLTPYLYCYRSTDVVSKIGKANNSTSRFKKDNSGIVICFRREGDVLLTEFEAILLKELSRRKIPLFSQKNEHFCASYIDLCPVILDICDSHPKLFTKIISITATKIGSK